MGYVHTTLRRVVVNFFRMSAIIRCIMGDGIGELSSELCFGPHEQREYPKGTCSQYSLPQLGTASAQTMAAAQGSFFPGSWPPQRSATCGYYHAAVASASAWTRRHI